ncbi:hypothetical protein TNCV_1933681 [Trichonephila clavipes]|nr:hypothetical protein TNCV_1933681 [Trichonephila clavipes]
MLPPKIPQESHCHWESMVLLSQRPSASHFVMAWTETKTLREGATCIGMVDNEAVGDMRTFRVMTTPLDNGLIQVGV